MESEEGWTQQIDDFVTYCAKYAPMFRDVILPASHEDVARLEALATHPFPMEYRAWLFRMGRTEYNALGRFLEDTEFGVEAVERFYQDSPLPSPSNAVFVACLDVDASFFLPIDAPPSEPRPFLQITYGVDPDTGAWMPGDRGDFVVGSSLLAWLYYEAFRHIRFPTLSYRGELRERNRSADQKPDRPRTAHQQERFREIASRLGFRALPWLTSDDPLCYDGEGAALLFFSEENARDSLVIKANDERELARLVEIFTDNFDFRVRG